MKNSQILGQRTGSMWSEKRKKSINCRELPGRELPGENENILSHNITENEEIQVNFSCYMEQQWRSCGKGSRALFSP